MTTITIANVFLLSCGATLIVMNSLLWRRYRALNHLLQHLCMQAWLMRKFPLIAQWLDYAELELLVVPRRHDAER
jgi:hypothetical protein